VAEQALAEGTGRHGGQTICRQHKSGTQQGNASGRLQTVGMAVHRGFRGSAVLSLSDLGHGIIPVLGVA
jgi:hypothetical protein